MPLDPISWFLIYMAINIGIAYVIDKLNKADIKSPDPGEFKYPEIKEGKEYPVIFGTCWVEDGAPVWWGDVSTVAIREKVGSKIDWKFGLPGHSSLKNDVYATTGYHYYIGMHMKLCHGPIDGIKQIRVGDLCVWPNADDKTQLQADGASTATINEPDLLGGSKSGGGIVGTVSIQYGSSSQTANSYLVGELGANISASRGLVGIILEHVNVGTSPYIQPWAFLCKRTDMLSNGSTQWYSAKADISGNLNAVHILRECLTNEQWGMHYSTGLIDSTTWEAAADTCYTEELGISRKFDASFDKIEEFIDEIKRHIDCILFQDMQTGNIKIKLIRDDYSIGSLETFDETDILAVNDFVRPSYGTIPTEILIHYWDIIQNDTVAVADDDIATLEIQGGRFVVKEIDYFGFTDGDVAAKIAARDRQQATSMLASFSIKAKRTMAHIQPGDVFVLDWPLLGISSMVVRVLITKYGTLNDGYMILDCVQDVFSVETAVYTKPVSSGWTDPRSSPADVTYYHLQEATYWDVISQTGVSGAGDLDNDTGFLLAGAAQPSGDSYDYEILVRDAPADDFESDGFDNFTPTGTLDTDMPLDAQDITVDMVDVQGLLGVVAGDYCVIENEVLKVLSVSVSTNQATLARGCLDTVPASHSGTYSGGPGARVWFFGSVNHAVGVTYTATDTPGVKFLPRTGKGILSEGSATAHDASAFNSRMIRPYPPGDFKVNSVSYPSTFSGQPTISWAHRDRTQQTETIPEHTDAGVGPEAGTTYTLSIYDYTGTGLLRTESGLSGTSYTYDWVDELSDSGLSSGDPLNSSLRFVLKSVRNGYDSWQSYDITVTRV